MPKCSKVTATDSGGSGVARIVYSIDMGPETEIAGAAATIFPEMGVFLVPYLVRSYDQAYRLFNGRIGGIAHSAGPRELSAEPELSSSCIALWRPFPDQIDRVDLSAKESGSVRSGFVFFATGGPTSGMVLDFAGLAVCSRAVAQGRQTRLPAGRASQIPTPARAEREGSCAARIAGGGESFSLEHFGTQAPVKRRRRNPVLPNAVVMVMTTDRKSTRLNSSH